MALPRFTPARFASESIPSSVFRFTLHQLDPASSPKRDSPPQLPIITPSFHLMPMNIIKIWSSLLIVIGGGSLHGQTVVMKQLHVPLFNEAGQMVRRLNAESLSGPFQLPKLEKGEIEFFRWVDDRPQKVALFRFNDALYHRDEGIVEGEGHASFHSDKGDLEGDGYRYTIASDHLELKSNVLVTIKATRAQGNHGEAFLVRSPSNQEWIIKKVVMDRGVVVTGFENENYKFDRAETATATYTGDDENLVLASPVTCWRGGEKLVTEANEITFNLSKKSPSNEE